MRKLLILLSTALILTGCGAAANREALKQASETSGVQESKATEYGVIGEAGAPSDKSLPEIPYVDYSDDLFDDTIVAPDDVVVDLPDAENDKDLIYYNGVYFHKSLPQSIRNAFFKYYLMEPKQVRETLNEYGLMIVVDKDGTYTGGHAGLYYAEARILAINGSSESKIAMSVNHELGHCVDSLIGEIVGIPIDEDIYWLGISNSEEYTDIFYDEYADSGFPEWNNYSSFEFFAETYRYVIEDNTYMLNKVPQSAAYVRKTINHYFGSPDEPIYPEY
ncbi:MAG: hypothetical protein K5868_06400 [Lachnospiraceae bacterium]|nr:hypothetical protein [Lachnospiraceae bacterium]